MGVTPLEQARLAIQILLVLYSIFFYFRYRDSAFLIFALFALTPIAQILSLKLPDWIDSFNSYRLPFIHWQIVLAGIACGLAYIRKIFSMPVKSLLIDKFIKGAILGSSILMIILLIAPVKILTTISMFYSYLCIALVIIILINTANIRRISWICIASGTLLFGISLTVQASSSFSLPQQPYYIQIIHLIANSLGMICYSLANIMQAERLQALVSPDDLSDYEQNRLMNLGIISSYLIHEVKNPLAAASYIQQSINTQLNRSELTPESLKKHSEALGIALKQMQSVIDDLAFFIFPTHTNQSSCIDVNMLFHKANRICQPLLYKQQIKLEIKLCKDPLFVWGNEFQLCQVLINLISNAVDAITSSQTPNGVIQLLGEKMHRHCRIICQDNGPGLPGSLNQILARLPFMTKAWTKRKVVNKNLGIGLKICKKIIDHHDGTFHYHTKNNEHYFEIMLPLFDESQIKNAPATHQ